MTDATATPENVPEKRGKKPIIIGFALALIGAGAGFFATQSGLIPNLGANGDQVRENGAETSSADAHAPIVKAADATNIAFVELDPIVITLNGRGASQHLHFRAHMEVDASHQDDVEKLKPRIVDVLNSYLRALEVQDLTAPMALTSLRAQMHRRINIVVGDDMVRDLLIMEFVLN